MGYKQHPVGMEVSELPHGGLQQGEGCPECLAPWCLAWAFSPQLNVSEAWWWRYSLYSPEYEEGEGEAKLS